MIVVNKSNIHGVGLFAFKSYMKGEKVRVVFSLDKTTNKYLPTKCSIYVNHSKEKNCDIILDNNEVWMIANKDIKQNEELTSNYRDLLNLCIDLTHLNINYDLE